MIKEKFLGLSAGETTITATLKDESATVGIEVIYRDYRNDLFDKGNNNTWYYVSSLKTEGGTENIDYTYALPSTDDATPDTYEYTPRTASSKGLTISKTSESFTVKITTGRDNSIAAVWVDWELDGYFAGNSDSATEENDFYFVGTPGGTNTAGELTATIPIPSRARVGKGRLRMMVNWIGDSSFPNGKFYTYDDETEKIWIEAAAVRDFDIEITE